MNVESGDDIYSSLNRLFDRYHINNAEGKSSIHYAAIAALPPILLIHAQRTLFDNITKRQYKSEEKFSFPEDIYLERYMDVDDGGLIMTRREQSWDWKERLNMLQDRRKEITSSIVSQLYETFNHLVSSSDCEFRTICHWKNNKRL